MFSKCRCCGEYIDEDDVICVKCGIYFLDEGDYDPFEDRIIDEFEEDEQWEKKGVFFISKEDY